MYTTRYFLNTDQDSYLYNKIVAFPNSRIIQVYNAQGLKRMDKGGELQGIGDDCWYIATESLILAKDVTTNQSCVIDGPLLYNEVGMPVDITSQCVEGEVYIDMDWDEWEVIWLWSATDFSGEYKEVTEEMNGFIESAEEIDSYCKDGGHHVIKSYAGKLWLCIETNLERRLNTIEEIESQTVQEYKAAAQN